MIEIEADVLVVGAGEAGMYAGVAAVRKGAPSPSGVARPARCR